MPPAKDAPPRGSGRRASFSNHPHSSSNEGETQRVRSIRTARYPQMGVTFVNLFERYPIPAPPPSRRQKSPASSEDLGVRVSPFGLSRGLGKLRGGRCCRAAGRVTTSVRAIISDEAGAPDRDDRAWRWGGCPTRTYGRVA